MPYILVPHACPSRPDLCGGIFQILPDPLPLVALDALQCISDLGTQSLWLASEDFASVSDRAAHAASLPVLDELDTMASGGELGRVGNLVPGFTPGLPSGAFYTSPLRTYQDGHLGQRSLDYRIDAAVRDEAEECLMVSGSASEYSVASCETDRVLQDADLVEPLWSDGSALQLGSINQRPGRLGQSR